MTSRFHASGSSPKSEDPNDAWQLAQQAIDATAANARAPLTKSSVQPSLYETLEANKGTFTIYHSQFSKLCLLLFNPNRR